MAYRFLHRSLLFCLVVHLLAMLSMATVLAPAMNMATETASRATWVANHPWMWRLGWLPWQGCALGDLLVSFALVWWAWSHPTRRRFVTRLWATLALVLTISAIIPEQWAESYAVVWMPTLTLEAYAARESWFLVMTGTCGGLAYAGMLAFWVLCAATAAPSSRWKIALLAVAAIDTALFIVAGIDIWRVTRLPGYPGFEVVEILNMVAFPLLLLVNVLLAGVLGQAAGRDFLGGVRDMLRPLPFLPIRSDITDVVYLNWWVPTQRVRHLLPSPLVLDQRNGMTALSILHYRHGGFGWAFLGPLRRLLPAPTQSNWRLYCEGDSIYFLHTLISNPMVAVGARLFSDGLPAVWDARLVHLRHGDRISVAASRLDLEATVVEDPSLKLHPDTKYLIERNGAIDSDPIWGTVRLSMIDIPIDLDSIRPARVAHVTSGVLDAIVEGCRCFAFVVPQVRFTAQGEQVKSRVPAAHATGT